jgi:hypothetical protein
MHVAGRAPEKFVEHIIGINAKSTSEQLTNK